MKIKLMMFISLIVMASNLFSMDNSSKKRCEDLSEKSPEKKPKLNEGAELYSACKAGDLVKVKELVQNKNNLEFVNPESKARPLHCAVSGGFTEIVRVLLAAGAEINAVIDDDYKETPLLIAVDCECKDIVRELLDHGANSEVIDSEGLTPLIIAVDRGNKDIVRELLARGANREVIGSEGLTPLQIASAVGNKDIVALLLGAKADIEAVDTDGAMPLHYAASGGFVDVIELLLNAKADIKAVDKVGAGPLHHASFDGRLDAAKYLLSKGARLTAINNDQLNAMDYAGIREAKESDTIDRLDKTLEYFDTYLAKKKGIKEKAECQLCQDKRFCVEMLSNCDHKLCITCLRRLRHQFWQATQMEADDRGEDPVMLEVFQKGPKCPICRQMISLY